MTSPKLLELEYAAFVSLVHRMRSKQRDYFRQRDPTVLEESKALEREVDDAIREFRDPQRTLTFD